MIIDARFPQCKQLCWIWKTDVRKDASRGHSGLETFTRSSTVGSLLHLRYGLDSDFLVLILDVS